MHIVVLSNDVVPGFGVAVAAPGLRAAGLAEGLRSHGHDVTVFVPRDVLEQLFPGSVPMAPEGSHVVDTAALMASIDDVGPEVVVFINANLTPQLEPRHDVRFVYDLFAPKVLELEASIDLAPAEVDRAVAELTRTKTRALALADAIWVNGARKIPYAAEWASHPAVAEQRSALGRGPIQRDAITVVNMAVPLPDGVGPVETPPANSPARLGIAGYAQRWSTLEAVHPGHQLLADAGHELHALLPSHWGGNSEAAPVSALPTSTVHHRGPLPFEDFAAWVQSMDAMVDVFAPSPERRFAMITRSAVSLRLGVPLVHAVDSEISNLVTEHNAGWVIDPTDDAAWRQVATELADPNTVATKAAGARRASAASFAPREALRQASDQLSSLTTPTLSPRSSASTLPPAIDVLVPFWGLAGGVIKILDYAEHAAELGLRTTIWAPPVPTAPSDPSNPIASLPVFQRLISHEQVTIRLVDELALDARSVVLFTEPAHHCLIERASPKAIGERLIHLVQGTRHATPTWNDGLNYRLLHRPMTRIAVSEQVAEAITPLVNDRYPTHTIVEGHDAEFFSGRPAASKRQLPRLRVLYTTWKSDLGDRVAAAATDDDELAFIAIRSAMGWPALRNRYHGADVLLCAPGPEEGFYLPGLEAMAAGVAVITSLVGGNAAYVRTGENALVAPYDDVDAHLASLRQLRNNDALRELLVAGGYETIAAHRLTRERAAFSSVLESLMTPMGS